MLLFKCVWFAAIGVAALGLGYAVAPVEWLRKWDRRRAQDIERRWGRRAVLLYFRVWGAIMFIVGSSVAIGLWGVLR